MSSTAEPRQGPTGDPLPSEALGFEALPDLCIPAEVANYFRVSAFTIRKWLRDGSSFPNAFRVSGSWRIPREDVLDRARQLYGDREGTRSATVKKKEQQ